MTIAAASSSATTQTSRNTSNAMTACSYAFVGTMSWPRHPNSWRPSSLLMKMHGWRGKLASGSRRFSVTTVTNSRCASAPKATPWRARGKAIEKQHRYEEAVEAYERAFELAHSVDEASRDGVLVRLVLALFNAGRPDGTIAWAEHAIAEGLAENRRESSRRHGYGR